MALVEVNLSCPNVEHRGEVFATDPAAAAEVVETVKRATSDPVLAKLTADVTDLVAVARAAVVDAGADGLTLINTLLGMAVDTGRAPAPAGRGHRRAVRPGDPAGGRPLRLAGRPGPPGGADRRHRRGGHR